MIDRDLAELLAALVVISACAAAAVATASPSRRSPVGAHESHTARAPLRASAPGSVAVADPVTAPSHAEAVAVPGARSRPRILTGEPAAPEPHRPAARRAFKLVTGVTALAAGGAIGLLALVRALVAMFDRIGG